MRRTRPSAFDPCARGASPCDLRGAGAASSTAVNPQRLGLRGAGAGSRREDACRPARRPASCGPGSSRRRHVPAPRELREEDDGLDGARTPRLRKTWPCEQRPRLTARSPPAVGADLHPQNPSGKPAAASCRDLAASASRPSGTSSRGVRREPPSWERGKRGLLRTRSIPLAPRASLSAGSVRTLLPPHALRVAQPLGPRLLYGRPFPRHRAPLCPCTATAGVLNGRDLVRASARVPASYSSRGR